jgi:hypothetical protein
MNTKAIITSLVTAAIIAMVSVVGANYSEIGKLGERDRSTEASLKRIEDKVDNIHRFLLERNDDKIL